jgi:cardiolipin synthase
MRGPVVAEIHRFALRAGARPRTRGSGLVAPRRKQFRRARPAARAGEADAMFVTRDNRRTWTTSSASTASPSARRAKRIVIANAYFFPGYRLIKELRRGAARRRRAADPAGRARHADRQDGASMLYHHLLNAGVRIYEYCERPLHGKVALMDDEWVHGGLEQPRPAEPVAQPRGQRHHPRPRLQPAVGSGSSS